MTNTTTQHSANATTTLQTARQAVKDAERALDAFADPDSDAADAAWLALHVAKRALAAAEAGVGPVTYETWMD